jgi:signal recognition particle subunit SEC65
MNHSNNGRHLTKEAINKLIAAEKASHALLINTIRNNMQAEMDKRYPPTDKKTGSKLAADREKILRSVTASVEEKHAKTIRKLEQLLKLVKE